MLEIIRDPWKFIVILLVIFYIVTRLNHKKLQKQYGLDNFEVWIFTHLIDYYKSKGYPLPEQRALDEILKIRKGITN